MSATVRVSSRINSRHGDCNQVRRLFCSTTECTTRSCGCDGAFMAVIGVCPTEEMDVVVESFSPLPRSPPQTLFFHLTTSYSEYRTVSPYVWSFTGRYPLAVRLWPPPSPRSPFVRSNSVALYWLPKRSHFAAPSRSRWGLSPRTPDVSSDSTFFAEDICDFRQLNALPTPTTPISW